MEHYGKYIRTYWKLGVLSILCVSLETVCDLFQPKLMSRLVDSGVLKGDMEFVIRMGIMMLGVVSLGAVFAVTRNVASSYVSQNFGRDLRDDLYVKIQSLPVDVDDRLEGGSLITRMTNDITQVQNSVHMIIRIFFKAPIMCVGALIMVGTLNIRAVALVIPVIIGVFSIIIISMKLSYPRYSRVQQALDRLNTTMREFLNGIRLVKAFRRFDAEGERFATANDTLAKRSIEAGRIMASLGPFMQFFANMGVAAIVFLGARWVKADLMEVGSIMAFVIYMQQITQSFFMIHHILNQVMRLKASSDRIVGVFDEPAPEPVGERVEAFDEGAPAIEFSNVSFEYSGSTGQPALDGVSFSVRSGDTVGIIGSTGSGKTTLSALLLRFYAPTGGAISIRGKLIDDIPETQLRERIAVVPQTAALFSGTIKDNILWGKPGASEEEMHTAAKLACAHSFICARTDGYGTLIGQGGVSLSGGQRQRVSIARALIRNPDILILDDCTSTLDALTEAEVRRNITEFASDITCLLITQRIGTVMGCDFIIALDNGKVAGLGKHDELMESCGMYRDIYRSQIGVYERNGH